VIGAGLGGLSAALTMKSLGIETEIYEQNAHAGGKAGERIVSGFRFDTGPSLITMPFVIDRLFEQTGAHRQDYLDYVPIDPLCRYFFPGEREAFDATADPEQMTENLGRLSVQDAQRWESFLRYGRGLYERTADLFLFQPIHELATLLTLKSLLRLPSLLKIDAFRSMHQAISSYFTDHRIRQMMDRYATYVGADPRKAPATLNMISYVEYGLPAVYIKGGIARLTDALTQRCAELDIPIEYHTPVRQIFHNSHHVTGLQTGEHFTGASAVVSNADAVTTFRHLIKGKNQSLHRLERLEPSLSGLIFYWGVEGKYPELAHHNIFFARNYDQEFEHLFVTQTPAEDLTVYVAVTSKKDEEHARKGHENWFVLVNMPSLAPHQDWDTWIPAIRERVLQKLLDHGLDIRNRIVAEAVTDPRDMERLYGSNRGSIYGISSNDRNTAFRRPANRNRDVKGLYFCGGSAHPGGGVPLVILSGQITGKLVKQFRERGKI